MMSLTEKIWRHHGIIGLIAAIGIVLLIHWVTPIEQIIYDWTCQYIPHKSNEPQVAVIAIDESSLMQLGDRIWQRSLYAQLIDKIAEKAKVIGLTIDLTLPTYHANKAYIDELITTYLPLLNDFSTQYSSLPTTITQKLTALEERLAAVSIELDETEKLARSFKQANKVFFTIPFVLGQATSIPAPSLPAYVMRNNLSQMQDQLVDFKADLTGLTTALPASILSENAAGMGYFNLGQNTLNPRRQPLIIQYNNHYFPSLALSLITDQQAIKLGSNNRLQINQLRIQTDDQLTIFPAFYPTSEPMVDSLVDVLQNKVDLEKYQDKIVLLGITAPHYSVTQNTPLGELPTVLILARTINSLLNHDFFITPVWHDYLQIVIFVLAMIYISMILPLIRFYLAIPISITLLLSLTILYIILMHYGFLVSLTTSGLLIICGHSILWVKQGFIAYQDAFRLHPDAVESNRLLGLAFQGQGQLDMALEKFRLCPPDEAILGLLYNLALDYELKGQLRHAARVYRYMLSHQSSFRDVIQRLDRVTRLRQPHSSTTNYLTDWLRDENSEKPFLGRYQLEKQLGKGAMGTVYLGKDPKLNRIVAIKTLALYQEVAMEESQEATIRFFREASAAGRLHHPHIIAIYDAGEEYDLAYIAMEYFSGGDLLPYTKRDNLLPIPTVISIINHIALALEYAHNQGVIHRDIKPANIMYNPATDIVKMTDFGIARLTDANKTKTGIILGTPSYMSPEQLAGKQVDGRSDLFSLGVMLYQLLTGELPFQANSLAALMFKITNEPPQEVSQLRANIPTCLIKVIDKALQKEITMRYQCGHEFAQALRDCNHWKEGD